MAIITGGASGMGDEFAAQGARAIVITKPLLSHCHRSPISPISLSLSLSLSFGGWLFWLLLVGWDLWIGVDVGYDVGFGSLLWVWDLGWVKVDEGCYGWSRLVKVVVGVCLMKWWIGGCVCLFELVAICLFESMLNRCWIVGYLIRWRIGGFFLESFRSLVGGFLAIAWLGFWYRGMLMSSSSVFIFLLYISNEF